MVLIRFSKGHKLTHPHDNILTNYALAYFHISSLEGIGAVPNFLIESRWYIDTVFSHK